MSDEGSPLPKLRKLSPEVLPDLTPATPSTDAPPTTIITPYVPITLPIIKFKPHHPFTDHYDPDPQHQEPSEVAAINISSQTTLKIIQDFRNTSILWMHRKTEKLPAIPGCNPIQNMKTISEKPNFAAHAIYIVKSKDGRCAILVPHHKEVVANDRPDLFMIQLSPFSRDLLNPGVVDVNNYLVGDAICVMKLHPHPEPPSFCTSFDGIMDPRNHRFWVVGDFYLVKREFQEDRLITRLSKGLVVEGCSELEKYDKSVLGLKFETLYYGKRFVPQLQMMERCTGVKDNTEGNPSYPNFPNFPKLPGIITEVKKNPVILSLSNSQDLFRLARFGASGIDSMINRHKDHEFYPSEITNVLITPKRQQFKFHITQETGGPPPAGKWSKGTKFRLDNDKTSLEMEVAENPEQMTRHLVITALPREKYRLSQLLDGTNMVVFQKIDRSRYHLSGFPSQEQWDAVPEDAPIKQCLRALFNGAQSLAKPKPMPQTIPGLSPEQSDFINAMVYSDCPALVVDSAFRSGKTLMAVLGASMVGARGVQVVAAKTEQGVDELVKKYLEIPEALRVKAVRVPDGLWSGERSDVSKIGGIRAERSKAARPTTYGASSEVKSEATKIDRPKRVETSDSAHLPTQEAMMSAASCRETSDLKIGSTNRLRSETTCREAHEALSEVESEATCGVTSDATNQATRRQTTYEVTETSQAATGVQSEEMCQVPIGPNHGSMGAVMSKAVNLATRAKPDEATRRAPIGATRELMRDFSSEATNRATSGVVSEAIRQVKSEISIDVSISQPTLEVTSEATNRTAMHQTLIGPDHGSLGDVTSETTNRYSDCVSSTLTRELASREPIGATHDDPNEVTSEATRRMPDRVIFGETKEATLPVPIAPIGVDRKAQSGVTSETTNRYADRSTIMMPTELRATHGGSSEVNSGSRYQLTSQTIFGEMSQSTNRSMHRPSQESTSDITFSRLWPLALFSKILEVDASPSLDFDIPLIQSTLRHLITDTQYHRKLLYHLFSNKTLQDLFNEVRKRMMPASMGLFETFMRCYQPRMVFGTVAQVIGALGAHGAPRGCVSSVVVDQAHLLSLHEILALGTYCPYARVVLLGDSKQVGPYVDQGFPKILETYAIADFFKRASTSFPCFKSTDIYDCPPRLTNICSQLFYDGSLKFVPKADPTIEKALGEHFRNQIPVQVARLEHLTDEPRLVEGLIEQIRRKIPRISIGIISFAKPRTLPKNVFIGTPDTLNGEVFDMTIVLVTGFSSWEAVLSKKETWLTILSTARNCCVMLVDSKAEQDVKMVRLVLRQLPIRAFHDGKEFIEKFCS